MTSISMVSGWVAEVTGVVVVLPPPVPGAPEGARSVALLGQVYCLLVKS